MGSVKGGCIRCGKIGQGEGANLEVNVWHTIVTTHCLLLQEIQIGFGFTFLVPAHAGSPRQNPDSHKMIVVVVVVNTPNSKLQLKYR